MPWILALLIGLAEARTQWRALGAEADPLREFLRKSRAPVAVLIGSGAVDLALRFAAASRNVIRSPEQARPNRTNVMLHNLRAESDQDALVSLVAEHPVRLILVVEDPRQRIEWGLRRRARLIEVEPGCARELGTTYHGWYQLDLFN